MYNLNINKERLNRCIIILKSVAIFIIASVYSSHIFGQSLKPGFYATGPLTGVSSSAGLSIRNPAFKLPNGNYLVSGWSAYNSAFNFAKVDHNFSLVSIKELPNASINRHRHVLQLSDASIIAVGQSSLTGVENLSIVRIDANLNQVWTKTYSFGGRDFSVNTVYKCSNDDIIVIGNYFNGSVALRQILRIDENNGTILNSYAFQNNTSIGSIIEDSNGSIFVWGRGLSVNQVLLYKFNSNLSLVSLRQVSLTLPSGVTNLNNAGSTVDSQGNLWSKYISGFPYYSLVIKYNPTSESVVFVKSTADELNGVFIPALEGDGMIINSRQKFQKFSNNLTPVWAKESYLPASEGASAGFPLDYAIVDGNYYIIPHAASATRDWVMKIKADGQYNTSCLPQNSSTNSTFSDVTFTVTSLTLPTAIPSTPTSVTEEFTLASAPSASVVLRTVCSDAFPPEICNNNIDDDGDGLVDCADSDCGQSGVPSRIYKYATSDTLSLFSILKQKNGNLASIFRDKNSVPSTLIIRISDVNENLVKWIKPVYPSTNDIYAANQLTRKLVEYSDGGLAYIIQALGGFAIVKLKPDYTLDWIKQMPVTTSTFMDYTMTSQGLMFFCTGSGTDLAQTYIISSTGAILKQKSIQRTPAVTFALTPLSITELSSGSLLITGSETIVPEGRMFVMKLDADLGTVFYKSYNVGFENATMFPKAVEGANGNIYIASYRRSASIGETCELIKLDPSGTLIEAKTITNSSVVFGNPILDTEGDGVYLNAPGYLIANYNFEPSISLNWAKRYKESIPSLVLQNLGTNPLFNGDVSMVKDIDEGIIAYYNYMYTEANPPYNNHNPNFGFIKVDKQGNLGSGCSPTAHTTLTLTALANFNTITPAISSSTTTFSFPNYTQIDPLVEWTTDVAASHLCSAPLEEICNNGADDDGDGLIDSADPDCACAVASCDKIPNVAYVLSLDVVDPMANNNRGNADLKLGSCTCDLNPIAYEVQCNNNGTPNNPADDTYTITNFIVTAAAGGGVGGYILSGGITASGNAYGTAYSYGPFPISGGPLSVTVTDVNTTTCTRTDQIIPPLSCSSCTVMGAANGDAVCAGESIQLTASGGNTYSWEGPNGYTSTDQNPVINGATTAMAGNYSVTVTNTVDGGCTDVETVVVVVTEAPAVSAGADVIACQSTPTSLTATGCAGTLQWCHGESSSTISVQPLEDAIYCVRCTVGGCVGTDSVLVAISKLDISTIATACNGSTNTYTLEGSLSYINPPAGGTLTISTGGMSQNFSAPFPSTYSFSSLPADGELKTVTAVYSNAPSCTYEVSYRAALPCTLCDITDVSAAPNPCNPLTNQYNLTGSISFSNAPSGGTLTVSAGGNSVIYNAPFVSPLAYNLPGLLADGTTQNVTAMFSDDAGCFGIRTFTAPSSCTPDPCTLSLTALASACDVNSNFYEVNGTITFTNAPTNGTLTVFVQDGGTQSFNAPFSSPITYTIPTQVSDGLNHTVIALFSGNAACNNTANYTAPALCAMDCNIRLSMEVGVCDPNTNTYAVTGEVYINNPPSGGNIIISYPGGQQTVANTGVSPVSFQIPGLPASGGIGEIGVTMSNDLPCYTNSIYEIPESCGMLSLCSISAMASASPCDPERNDYTLTGTLTFSNAPTGNIILEIDGITHTITGPVSSPLMYEIPGMPSDGSDHQLLVYFENNANCSNRLTYTAPAVCAPNTCTMSMDLLTGSCQSATNTFSVSGSLTVSNAPASGQLRIWIEGTGFETVINAPFGANIPFSFNNMVSSGLPYDIKASFSADLSCQVRKSFIAPDACFIGGGCEVQVLAAAECTSGATFTVTGMVLIQNAPLTGTMTISAGPLQQTLSAPFDPMVFIGFSGFPLGTDVPVEITFSADAGCSVTTTVDAPQDCNCEVSLGTVSGLCVEGTETHNARGTVTLVNPPLTGTLTISVPGGQSEVFTAPFNSPLYYEVTGLPDGGGSRTVTAAFSADAGCTTTQSYMAPVDCPICDIQLPVVQSLSCYNNDTPSKIADNKIRIRLLVTNANPALTTYNLTVNGGTTISPALGQYGVSTEFTMGPGTAGGGATFIITIADSSGLTCNTAEVTVPDPGNCNNTTECPNIKCGSVIIQVNGN